MILFEKYAFELDFEILSQRKLNLIIFKSKSQKP